VQLVYLYRAVDKAGRTVDFLLSRNRDVSAAKTFLPQPDEEQARTDQDHSGRLRGIALRNERDRRTSAPSKSAIEPILE